MLDADAGVTPSRSASALFVTAPSPALLERVDRLRVVLDRLGGRGDVLVARAPPSDSHADQEARRVQDREAGQDARHAGGVRARAATRSRIEGASCWITCTIAPAPAPEQERRQARVERRGADPGAQDRRRSRRSGRGARAARGRAAAAPTGATIARPSVVLCSAKPITRNAPSASAPTAYADPIARPSPRLWRPIAIATSIATWAPPSRLPASRRRPCSHASTPLSSRYDVSPPRNTSAAPPSACEPSPATSMPSSVASIARNAEQPDRERHQDAQPARVDAPHERQPQHPERDRHDAHVEPEQRHQPVEAEVGVGRLDRHRDLVRDRRAGRGHELHLVGVALDPVVADRDLRGVEPPELAVGGA